MLIYKKDENGFISLKEKLQSVIEELNKELDQVCKQQSTSPVDDECESIQEDLGAKLPLEIAPIFGFSTKWFKTFHQPLRCIKPNVNKVAVNYIDFSSDRSFLVSGGEDCCIRLWRMRDIIDGKQVPVIPVNMETKSFVSQLTRREREASVLQLPTTTTEVPKRLQPRITGPSQTRSRFGGNHRAAERNTMQ